MPSPHGHHTPTNSDVALTSNIQLTATDGSGATANIGPFNIDVINVNDSPVISGIAPVTAAQGSAYQFTPVFSDIDTQFGDVLTVSAQNLPSWLVLNTTTGEISGTPANADVGSYNDIIVTVTDTSGSSASLAAFSVVVSNVNDAPVISGTPSTSVNQDALYQFSPSAIDVDNDSLSWSILNAPSWTAFDQTTGVLTGTPSNSDVGSYSNIVISVSDGVLTSSLAAFAITVANVNDAPRYLWCAKYFDKLW